MKIQFYGDSHANTILVQAVDDHDLSLMENEVSWIRAFTGRSDFLLAAFKTEDWNHELSPWEAPPVFGQMRFGDGAATRPL